MIIEYVLPVNEKNDATIAATVAKLFSAHGGQIPLEDFRNHLRQELKFNADPLQTLDSLGQVPLSLFEHLYRGNAYRVLGNIVYQTEPEKS